VWVGAMRWEILRKYSNSSTSANGARHEPIGIYSKVKLISTKDIECLNMDGKFIPYCIGIYRYL